MDMVVQGRGAAFPDQAKERSALREFIDGDAGSARWCGCRGGATSLCERRTGIRTLGRAVRFGAQAIRELVPRLSGGPRTEPRAEDFSGVACWRGEHPAPAIPRLVLNHFRSLCCLVAARS